MSLRPIAEIVRGLIAKIVIRQHISVAMTAASAVEAVEAFVEADDIRRKAGLTWPQVLMGDDAANDDGRRVRGAA